MKKKNLYNFLIQLAILFCLFTSVIQAQQIVVDEHNNSLAWKFKTSNFVYASPVLKGDTIFVGSLDSTFYALNAKNGSKHWEYKLPGEVRSTAAISEKKILFESENILYALNFQGELQWKVDLFKESLQNQIDPWDIFHSSPIIHQENVYIGTENGLILGFRIHDGKEVFHCQTENKDIIRTTPAISNNSIFFGDWKGVVYAYSLENAEELWQYDTKQDTVYKWKNAIQASPVISGHSIYFAGRSSRLYSLNTDNGTKNWVHVSPTNQWLCGGVILKDEFIYLGSSDQRLFQAFEAISGELQWQTTVDCRSWGTPCVNDNTIYIGSNSFYAIDKKNGEIKSQVQFDKFHQDIQMGKYTDRRANIHSSPVLYDNKVIFGSDDGYVYALDLSKI